MAAVDVGMRHNPPINDDLDNLFNYDVDENIYRDVDTNMDIPSKPAQPVSGATNGLEDGLGLEQEIKVRKARQPVPKLDENRLLSQAGIPKLRKLTKERLRMKGKGHEFSDVARLLNLYQLWLDDLYPRAKFADGLAMIEKLGHTKRMQVMRKEWIREGRAKESSSIEDVERGLATSMSQPKENSSNDIGTVPAASLRTGDGASASKSPTTGDHDSNIGEDNENSLFLSDVEKDVEEDFDDDLDAIMAEDEARQALPSNAAEDPKSRPTDVDEFADEEEAMRDMEDFSDDDFFVDVDLAWR